MNIIVAIANDNIIGGDNKLLWHLSDDLKRFKRLTVGNTIIMGRKTYESIGKALPNRKNVVITRDENYKLNDAEVINDINEIKSYNDDNCFIIGGGEIYKQTLKYVNKLYVTKIHEDFEGDTIFPEIDDNWIIENREDKFDEKSKLNYSYIEYVRR